MLQAVQLGEMTVSETLVSYNETCIYYLAADADNAVVPAQNTTVCQLLCATRVDFMCR